jgi:ArsR family transcriptional regulator, arsenate/arsenite/antimonite-responsive transcriptional repressor / arsenate reductase (thioredoxin)
MTSPDIERRAAVHAALGDPMRLAIVEDLMLSDRSPAELADRFDIPSNLLAHHIHVLASAGLLTRTASFGDRRRRYLRLLPDALVSLLPHSALRVRRVVFVCTANSARSQFARAVWATTRSDVPATSGGTRPAVQVHPGAVGAAQRAGIHLQDVAPQAIPTLTSGDLVVTVCDRAHEEMAGRPGQATGLLHWSVPDPVEDGDFDGVLAHVRRRVDDLSRHVVPSETSSESSTANREES